MQVIRCEQAETWREFILSTVLERHKTTGAEWANKLAACSDMAT